MSDSKPSEPTSRTTDELIEGVSQVVTAALGVGAAMAKAVAEATAQGQPLPPPAQPGSPLTAIVHYGVATVTNVAGAVMKSVGGIRMDVKPRTAGPAATAAARGPRAHQGTTLRVPLSIENPSDHPMLGVAYRCLELTGGDPAAGVPLGRDAVRFLPPVLDVQPRDFEKLTVYIDTQPDTAPGRYRARIGTGAGGAETALDFEVVAAG
jgi:hypothetical protein